MPSIDNMRRRILKLEQRTSSDISDAMIRDSAALFDRTIASLFERSHIQDGEPIDINHPPKEHPE